MPDLDSPKLPQVHLAGLCISINVLRDESSSSDERLASLRHQRTIHSGRWNNASVWEQPFKRAVLQLSVDKNNITRLGSKVVPPQSLYHRIFDVAHQTHSSVASTFRLIQQGFFWPAMRAHVVESFVKNCQMYRSVQFGTSDTTHVWPKNIKL